jgi:hypothetical protein
LTVLKEGASSQFGSGSDHSIGALAVDRRHSGNEKGPALSAAGPFRFWKA